MKTKKIIILSAVLALLSSTALTVMGGTPAQARHHNHYNYGGHRHCHHHRHW